MTRTIATFEEIYIRGTVTAIETREQDYLVTVHAEDTADFETATYSMGPMREANHPINVTVKKEWIEHSRYRDPDFSISNLFQIGQTYSFLTIPMSHGSLDLSSVPEEENTSAKDN